MRVYEIRNTYPEKDFAFSGVLVKESLVRGMSDYVNFSGPFTTYTVYTLEDGNKVFAAVPERHSRRQRPTELRL